MRETAAAREAARGRAFPRLTVVTAVFLWTAALSSPAWSAETEQGRVQGPTVETLARGCAGCHGIDGVSPGAIPTIAGKAEDYLVARMAAFRDGKRESTIMGRILKPFSNDDIARLAHYFASRKCAQEK